MRTFIALTAVAVTSVGLAGPALADTGVTGDNCVEINETRVVNGVTVNSGRSVVCESHDVSESGVHATTSTDLGIPSVEFDAPIDPGSSPPGATPDAEGFLDLLCGLRGGAWGESDIEPSADALYRRVVSCLGFRIYENTVCGATDESELECWATDYLVGDYVGNYLIDWVADRVPVPAPLKQAVQDAIHEVVDRTNGEGEPPVLPTLPELPTLPGTPGLPEGFAIPGLPGGLPVPRPGAGGLPGQNPGVPGVPGVPGLPFDPSMVPGGATPGDTAAIEAALAELEQKAAAQLAAVDAGIDAALTAAEDGTEEAFDQLDATTTLAHEEIRELRRDAEAAVQRLIDQSGRGPEVDRARRLAERIVERASATVDRQIAFLRSELGL